MNCAMDNEILRKILKYNNKSLPTACKYPLVIPEIANDVSASIVKMLSLASQSPNTTMKTNLRRSILEYTRKLCTADSKTTCFDSNDAVIEVLLAYLNKRPSKLEKVYNEKYFSEEIDNLLVAETYITEFASRRAVDQNLSQEIAIGHALLNLEPGNLFLQNIIVNLLNSSNKDFETMSFFRRIWESDDINDAYVFDRLLTKLIPDIETVLLKTCTSLITLNEEIHGKNSMTGDLLVIVKRCSLSTIVFQTCCDILNYIFINSNYNDKISKFIHCFLTKIKELRCDRTIVNFYSRNLQSLVFYLDLDSDLVLSNSSGEEIKNTIRDMSRNLYKTNFSHFVMLLCHFPNWLEYIATELRINNFS